MEIQMLLKDHFNFIIRANYIVANVKEKLTMTFQINEPLELKERSGVQ